MSFLAIDIEYWVRELVRFAIQTPIGIALVIAFVAMATGYRSRFNFLRRRNYSVDPEEFRIFDEQAALEEWKRTDGQDT